MIYSPIKIYKTHAKTGPIFFQHPDKIKLLIVMSEEELSNDIFKNKIDQQWSDLFWDLFKGNTFSDIALIVDDAFLRFFNYITDMLIVENEIMIDEETDSFDIIKKVYSDVQNVDYLFNMLDLMATSRQRRPDFYQSILYIAAEDFDPTKVRIYLQGLM